MHSITSQAAIFVTHGLPVRVVTDNGPQFYSNEFSQFLKANEI